jgi:hypothetical protein
LAKGLGLSLPFKDKTPRYEPLLGCLERPGGNLPKSAWSEKTCTTKFGDRLAIIYIFNLQNPFISVIDTRTENPRVTSSSLVPGIYFAEYNLPKTLNSVEF